jgi:hypothetical protein
MALVRERGWKVASAVAAYDAQMWALRLTPWEKPPCVASSRGKGRAAVLLRRMLRRGISRWHPRPLEAIAEAANTSGVLENQLAHLRRLESLTEAPRLCRRACQLRNFPQLTAMKKTRWRGY